MGSEQRAVSIEHTVFASVQMLYNRKRKSYEAAHRSFEHTYGHGLPRHVLHFYNIHPRALSAPSSQTMLPPPDLNLLASSRTATRAGGLRAPAFDRVGTGTQPARGEVKALSAPAHRPATHKLVPELSSEDPLPKGPTATGPDQNSSVTATGAKGGARDASLRLPTVPLVVSSKANASLLPPRPASNLSHLSVPAAASHSNRTSDASSGEAREDTARAAANAETETDLDAPRPLLQRASTSPALLRGVLRAATARPHTRAPANRGNVSGAEHKSVAGGENAEHGSTSSAPRAPPYAHLAGAPMGLKRVHIRTPTETQHEDPAASSDQAAVLKSKSSSSSNWNRASTAAPRSALQLRVDNFCARIESWKRELRATSGSVI